MVYGTVPGVNPCGNAAEKYFSQVQLQLQIRVRGRSASVSISELLAGTDYINRCIELTLKPDPNPNLTLTPTLTPTLTQTQTQTLPSRRG